TETILHAYWRWGPEAVRRLRGIFAFAIWDERSSELFAARDHLGVKPFHMAQIGDGLAIASQVSAFFALGAFRRTVRAGGFVDALRHGVSTGGQTIFEGVTSLAPGHSLTWRDGETQVSRYWSLPDTPDIGSAEHAAREVSELIADSVNSQMLGDVPVHSLLSGGIDSSLMTALAMRREQRFGRAYTLRFDDPDFDEERYAEEAAKSIGCEREVRTFPARDTNALLDTAIAGFDEPYGIDSCLPMVAIAQFMAEDGVKVALSGDGGDELFGGYRHYDDLSAHYARRGRATAQDPAASIRGRLFDQLTGGFSPFPTYTSHNGWFANGALRILAGPRIKDTLGDPFARERTVFPLDRPPVEAARRADLASYLPDEILPKIDRATMAFGIEARVPLLDHRLVELAFRIEPELHYRAKERKALLKSVAAHYLPGSLLTGRKKGFSLPITSLFFPTAQDRKRAIAQIASGPLVEHGWLAAKGIARAVSRSEYSAGALFQLMLIDRWYRHWIAGNSA
ncbi:MAG: asparagine synthase (glutamine-hydrolyzing), partial [Erythrobacter sp.]